MERNKSIKEIVEETMNAMDTNEAVNVSPFFKDKTMQKMFAQEEEEEQVWSWFTPKVQLATLVCVVILNILAFTQLNSGNYDSGIDEFAEIYGLSSGSDMSLFN